MDILKKLYENRGRHNEIPPSRPCPTPVAAPAPRYRKENCMKLYNVEVIEDKDKWDFEEKIKQAIKGRSVIDIKFAVTPDIHSGSFRWKL